MNTKEHLQQNSASEVRELIDSGKAAEALKMLQQMIVSTPENAELYYLLGDAFYQKEEWNDARQAYLKAVNLHPNMTQASIGFGDASVELKAYVEADQAYKHALQQDSSVAKQLALCYKSMGDALTTDLEGKASYCRTRMRLNWIATCYRRFKRHLLLCPMRCVKQDSLRMLNKHKLKLSV